MKPFQLVWLILIGIFVIFLTGCNEVDVSKLSDQDLERISEKAVVCNKPYIRIGLECCLDQNSNSICDKDEQGEQEKKTVIDDNKNEYEEIKISATKTKYDLGDYPNFLIQGGVFKGVLVIGDKAPSADVISITDIAMSLAYSIENNGYPITIGETKLASELDDIKSKNAILVGSPCINKGIADLFPKFESSKCLDDYTYSGIPKNKGIILVVENNGNTQIIVTGYSQTNINHASKVLLNYKNYKLDGNLITIDEDGRVEGIEKANMQEIKTLCKDDCFTDDCSGFEFISCEMKSDGCKDKINKGIIKGKCDVECTTNSHCNQNYECKSYQCIAKPVEVKETQDTEGTSKLNALQTCYKRAKECSDNIIGVELEFRAACNDLYLWSQTATEILDFANGLC